ncbi:N-terminal binuclear Zn cluster-containing protein [Trichoderma ceciliae]
MNSGSATTNFPIPSEIPRRRNGRPQACEPCRRRKVACDHRLPICSRCIRKSTPQSCRYLIQGQLVTPALPSVNTRSPAEVPDSRQHGAPGVPNPPTLSPSTLQDLASPSDENIGYLGATSFPEFYRETRKHLDYVAGLEPTRDSSAGNNESGMAWTSRTVPDVAAFEIAFTVLRTIPTKEASKYLYERNVNPCDAWCRLAVDRLHNSLWVALGHFLEGERSNESMSQLALLLFQNSSKPLKEDFSDPEQWFDAFSGANFRWEGLGLLFAFWTFGALSLSENGGVEQRRWLGTYSRRNLLLLYKNSTTKCVDLCRLASCNNTMMVYLLHEHGLTASVITGDTGAEFWRHHAEAVALATFLGLHTSQPSNPLPEESVSVQAKRRVFCAIFNVDMLISTLTGRPPLLSSRLCSTPFPLDVDDASLMNTKITNYRLDSDGWNTEGKNHSATFLRAAYILGQIRSEILEMVLQAPNLRSRHNLDELRKREMDAISQVPIGLQFKNEDFSDPAVDAPTLYMRLLTRLEHLSNLFFIERLSHKGSDLYSSYMLEISLEMISLTLSFWTQQNRLEGLQGDYEWLVMVHAAPAGGILCMELLKTSSSTGGAAEAATTSTITKPMIIKQLSLLIGFLEWIGPSAPGAHLCNGIRTVVERVIEQALNPAPRPPTQLEFDMTWDTSLPEDMNEFNFGLLDTFDWLRIPLNTT